jgi:DivIVA domain-containing protein
MMENDEVTPMALTPEDVVNKRFNPTKFREGYDQDEVDDFLDEVVVELRRLNQENEELRQRLVAGDGRINELQRAAAAAAVVPAVVAAPEPIAIAAAPEPVATPVESMDPGNTNNLLQLARRLHEEHVREGMEKRDSLIAEGHATAARVVSEAQTTQQVQLAEAQAAADAQLNEAKQAAQAQIAEAQQTQASELAGFESEKANLEQTKAGLEQDKNALENQIDELRSFEKEYREKLRSYIEGQLQELESSSSLTGGATAPAAAHEPAPQFETAPAVASAGYDGPQSPDYGAYPQPADYPGFAAGN